MKNRLRFNPGFSLIEILCVIMILAVVAGLVVPNFQNTFKSVQLRKTAGDLTSLMRYAQDRAITKGLNVRVRFSEDYSRFWLEQQSSVLSQDNLTYEKMLGRLGKVFFVDPSITVEANVNMVHFNPDGAIEPQRIYLCKKDNCYTISTQEQRNMVRIFQGRIE